VKKNSEAATDDERRKLEVVGQYHVGDFVNRFRRGSLVMKLPETEISNLDTLLFCTTGGSLGVLATLPPAKYQFLHKVQVNLTKIIKGVGGLKHEMYVYLSADLVCLFFHLLFLYFFFPIAGDLSRMKEKFLRAVTFLMVT
jgi:hypothetical protein